jgi:hypothetical protein
LSKLARLLDAMGRLEHAEACLKRLLDLRLQALGEESESVSKTRAWLADVRQRLGNTPLP